MKKLKKIILTLLLIIVIGIAALLSYVKLALPNVGEPETITVEATPERIARGEYLANCVTVCMDCHSTRDWNKFSGPLVEGTLGKGGETFDQKFGFPGSFYSRNITPAGISDWTDGELLRVITCGVNKKGKAIFPVMPHPNYGKMDKEDILSIIAYLRTLKPIQNEVPESKPDFPMNFIINTIPVKAKFSKKPSEDNTLAYGEYLFNAAACSECHTQNDKGKKIAGMELAGGFNFPLPSGGVVSSANITPDKETGIGNWTEEAFIKRFKMYADSGYVAHDVAKGTFNSVMPWTMYGKMKESDLKAIFTFLKTQKPIKNSVTKFTAG